jgi:branched-chain amino acid aminotransferase
VTRLLWLAEGLTDAPLLDPRDRGFTLGDGLFETMRAVGGRLPLLPLHLGRLRSSADVLRLSIHWTDAFLAEAIHAVLAANHLTDAAVRLTVSRGVPSHRGLLPDPQPTPTLVIDAEPFAGYPADLYERGAFLVTSRIPRNERSPLSTVKSTSRLEQLLARLGAAEAGADEALVPNTAGRVAGASAANVFVVVGRRLVTPSLEEGALPGVVRRVILEELGRAAGLEALETAVAREELHQADEVFLTSALLGILPVSSLDGRSIGPDRSAGSALAELFAGRFGGMAD